MSQSVRSENRPRTHNAVLLAGCFIDAAERPQDIRQLFAGCHHQADLRCGVFVCACELDELQIDTSLLFEPSGIGIVVIIGNLTGVDNTDGERFLLAFRYERKLAVVIAVGSDQIVDGAHTAAVCRFACFAACGKRKQHHDAKQHCDPFFIK